MEDELKKTSEGQNRLDRAKDRLDTKVAEIGQAEIERANNEQNIDKAQDDIVEGFLPETVVTDQKMEMRTTLPSCSGTSMKPQSQRGLTYRQDSIRPRDEQVRTIWKMSHRTRDQD